MKLKARKSSCFLCDHPHIEPQTCSSADPWSCWCVFMCVWACRAETNACAHVCVCVSFPCSPAVVVVRGAGSSPPAASPEEQAERTAGKSPHAAQHEQHEARPHTQVSGESLTHLLSDEYRLCLSAYLTANPRVSVQFKVTAFPPYQWNEPPPQKKKSKKRNMKGKKAAQHKISVQLWCGRYESLAFE